MTATGMRRALLLGVERYRSDRFEDLPSAGVDARELGRVLRDPQIGYFDDVVEKSGKALDAADMRREISTFLRTCEPDDFVVLYISGHGARTPRTDGQFHFVATDTDPDRLAETSVPAGFVNEHLESCRANRKVAIFDCCMSGGFALGFRSRDAKSTEAAPRNEMLDTTGVYVLSSSRISEVSFAGETDRDPSQFTGALIEGLCTGKADADRDGFVSVDELFDYVSNDLRAKDRSERQTPVKSTLQVSGQLHLARAAVRGSAGQRRGEDRAEAVGASKAPHRGAPTWPTLLDYYQQAVIVEQTGADLMDARPGASGYVCPSGAERMLSGAGDHFEIAVPPEAAELVREAWQAKKDLVYGYPVIVLHSSPGGTPYRHPRCAPLLIRQVKIVEGDRLAAYGAAQVNPVLARELLDRDTAAQLAVAYRPTWIAGDYQDMAADIRFLLTEDFALPEVERLRPELLSSSIDVATPTDGARNAAMLMPAPDNGATTNLIKDLEYIRNNPDQIRGTALATLLDGAQQPPRSPSGTIPVLIGRVNDAQRAVLESASTNRITVVTGPPGTGKSELISNLVATAVCAQRTVLVASTNNQAVDEVVDRCNTQVPGLLMRTGNQEYKQRQQDALAQLLQLSTRTASTTVTTAAAAHAHALGQHEQARRNVTTQAELEQRLLSCGRERRLIETKLAEIDVTVPATLTQSDEALLQKWRSKTAKVARASLLGSYRRRRLLRSLAIVVPTERQHDVCRALSERLALECTWRELRRVPQRADRDLLTDLASTAEQVRETSLRLASTTVAGAAAAAQTTIQELLGALMSQDQGTWRILLRLLPKVRGWAVSSLSARNFPVRAGLFDLVVIDEASQCSIAAVLPLLFRAKAAVIVGDPMQLRHIAPLRPDQDAEISGALGLDATWLADHRLIYSRHSAFDAWETQAGRSMLLDEHYRCHPHIASIADSLFYAPRGKRLTILTDPREQLAVAASKKPRAAWDDVPDGRAQQGPGRRSWLNRQEAELAAERTRWLLHALPASATIGIVTPFRPQADLISHELRNLGEAAGRVRVGTVHTFQGGQCDAIIFSLVATASMSNGGLRFFDRDENLWNVAITRAKAHLLVIGDRNYWHRHGALGGKLLARIDAIAELESAWPHGPELRDLLYARLAPLNLKDLQLSVPGTAPALDARFVGTGRPAALLLDPGPREGDPPGVHLRRQLIRTDIATPHDAALSVRRLPAWRLYGDDRDVIAAL